MALKLPEIYTWLPEAIEQIAQAMNPDAWSSSIPSTTEMEALRTFVDAMTAWKQADAIPFQPAQTLGLRGLGAPIGTGFLDGLTPEESQTRPQMPTANALAIAAQTKFAEGDKLLDAAWSNIQERLNNGRLHGFAFVQGTGIAVPMLMWGVEANIHANKTRTAVVSFASTSGPSIAGPAYLVSSEVRKYALTFRTKRNYGEATVFGWADREHFQPAINEITQPIGWREFYAEAQNAFLGIRKPIIESVWHRRPSPPFKKYAPQER